MAADSSRDPRSHLPLKAAVLEILLSLGDGDRHGYALLTEIAERTEGGIQLFPAQLYRHLRRMLEDGLIKEVDPQPASESDDERRRYYRLTSLGDRVAKAELKRLEGVLRKGRVTFRTAKTSG